MGVNFKIYDSLVSKIRNKGFVAAMCLENQSRGRQVNCKLIN